jgi:hypothetical protein
VTGRPAALFFDLENVIGGYGEGFVSRVGNLSLIDLEAQIAAASVGPLGDYAVKRAYADWSKGGLKVLRKALVEQGIEPRQVFGFGDGGKTNAADIELVIDVLELAYQRPEVTTFVIVSGDGGFGSLVRKLHEFGKHVIVAAYSDRAGRALRSVCDVFVVLERTEVSDTARLPSPAGVPSSNGTPGSSSVRRIVDGLGGIEVATRDGMLDFARKLFAELQQDAPALALLSSENGIPLSELGAVLYTRLDGEAIRVAFRGLTGYLEAALVDFDGLTVVRGQAGVPSRVVFRENGGAQVPEPPATPAPGPSVDDLHGADPRELPDLLRPVVEAIVQELSTKSITVSRLMIELTGSGVKEQAKDYYQTATNLLRVALRDSALCVTRSKSDATRTAVKSRAAVDDDVEELLSNLDPLDDAEFARQVLRANRVQVPAETDDMWDVLTALERAPFASGESPSHAIARLIEDEQLPEAVELTTARQTMLLLLICGVLEGPQRGPGWIDAPCEQTVTSAVKMRAILRDFVKLELESRGMNADAVMPVLLPGS